MAHKTSVRLALLLLLCTAFALPLALLDRHPLREDEAIYGYWALHALREDPLFLQVWPDKPPLFLWLLGGTLQLFGATAAGARVLGIAAHVLTVAATAALSRRLWNQPTALCVALLLALNPFAISFAPTVYTDSTLVLFGTLALCLAVYKRPFAAGFWLGCAIMTKQQGVLYAPLVLGTLLLHPHGGHSISAQSGRWLPRARRVMHQFARRYGVPFLAGLALIVLPILLWDSLRWSVAPSPWDLGARNYARLHLLPPDTWWERAQQWLDIVWYVAASPVVWFGAIGAALGAIWLRRPAGRRTSDLASPSPISGTQLPFLTLVVLWGVAFAALHVVASVQIWDRYLLPLIPLWALMLGRATGMLLRSAPSRYLLSLWILLVVLLAPPALQTVGAEIPIGGDHGAYDGLDAALGYLQQSAHESDGERAVLYHRALGWHYQFYLYSDVRDGAVELRWFPHSTYLVDNVLKTPHKRIWLLLPDWSPQRDLAQRAAMQRVRVVSHGRFGHFRLVELVHEPEPFCAWCLCAPALDTQDAPLRIVPLPALETLAQNHQCVSDAPR